MRILQVIPRYAPAWSYGGGVRMFWSLAKELATRGHEISVVTSDALDERLRCESLEEELERGITVRRFRNINVPLAAVLAPVFLRPRGMAKGLRVAVKGADVVHMGESRGIHNVWTADACAEASTPLVWSPYGGLAEARGVRGAYRRLHDLLYTRAVVNKVTAFVAQTEHERGVCIEHGAPPAAIHDIPLCVDLAAFTNLPGRGAFRAWAGIPEAAPLVVSVARLHPAKGMDILIRAFAHLQVRGATLALVGWDHGALPNLRRLTRELGVESRVFFPGPLFGEERLTAYVDADVFALTPWIFEETSLAALEAAACGCPTALTPECEIPGMATAGAGVVMENTVTSIASGLESILGDADLRRQMAQNAVRHVRENFSVQSVASAHERLFMKLAR